MRNYLFLLLPLCLLSCNGNNSGTSKSVDEPEVVEVSIDSVSVAGDTSKLHLQSYNPTSYLDQNRSVYGYNYKRHGLDVIDMAGLKVDRFIPFEHHGPDAVNMQVAGLKALSPDTIAIYDGIAVCLIDSMGKVRDRIKLSDDYYCNIETNSRMNITDFNIDFDKHTETYPAVNHEKGFEVVVYDFGSGSVLKNVRLRKPVSEGKHGFMGAPNVTFNKDLAIYNYPFESDIYVYDMSADSTRVIHAKSNFVDEVMPESKGNTSELLERYGMENFFHSPLYYLEKEGKYVMVTLDGAPVEPNGDIAEAIYGRKLYAMYFDKDFNPVGECELPQNRYNPFVGWFTTPEYLGFFVENVFHPVDEDTILIDKVTYKDR